MIVIRSQIDLLIENSSPPLGGDVAGSSEPFRSLLVKRNGFYAFFSALCVYPSGAVGFEGSLEWWNGGDGWRSGYEKDLDDFTAFACDVFGGQFLLCDEIVFYFDPETGEIEGVSDSIEGWAHAILQDPEYLTGYPLAEMWQKKNGPIPPGFRLVPKTPFVLGGEFSVENLHAMSYIDSMRMRSRLANNISNIPDGGKIILLPDGE